MAKDVYYIKEKYAELVKKGTVISVNDSQSKKENKKTKFDLRELTQKEMEFLYKKNHPFICKKASK